MTNFDAIIGKHGWISPAQFNELYTCTFKAREPAFPESHAEFTRYCNEMQHQFSKHGFNVTLFEQAKEKDFERLFIRNPLTGREFAWSYHRQNRYGAMMQLHHQFERLMTVGPKDW